MRLHVLSAVMFQKNRLVVAWNDCGKVRAPRRWRIKVAYDGCLSFLPYEHRSCPPCRSARRQTDAKACVQHRPEKARLAGSSGSGSSRSGRGPLQRRDEWVGRRCAPHLGRQGTRCRGANGITARGRPPRRGLVRASQPSLGCSTDSRRPGVPPCPSRGAVRDRGAVG